MCRRGLAATLCLLVCGVVAQGQYTPGALTSISGISGDKGAAYLASQGGAATSTAPASSFVRRVGAGLQLGGVPYEYNGFNNYYMLQKSLANSTRQQVTDALALAQSLNLTVMRSWAFTDGSDQYAPIQPELGMLDQKALTEGLDYFVAQAEQYGIKLILCLTNYFADYGGAQQYVEWNDNSNASTVSEFYQNPTYQGQYNDYITAIILRKNSITGRLYRDDPNILAWDIINEPANPGDTSGDVLFDWLSSTSAYVKSIDPNHLVYYGTPGFFGSSTPDLINLDGNYSGQYSPYRGSPYYPGCQGEDWVRFLGIESIDLASYHIYPNAGPYEFPIVESQIQAHISQAAAAGKPLVFDEFNRKRPVSARNNFLQMVYSMGQSAGSTVVGYNVWMPSSSTYPDYDGFEIYGDQAGQAQDIPAGPNVTADYAILLARRSIFRNFVAADACVNAHIQSNDYVGNFQETLSIIQNQS